MFATIITSGSFIDHEISKHGEIFGYIIVSILQLDFYSYIITVKHFFYIPFPLHF